MLKHCDRCDVDIDLHIATCPLCGSYLEDRDQLSDTEEYLTVNYDYPKVGTDQMIIKALLKMTILICFVSIGVCAVVNYLTHPTQEITWLYHVIVGWSIFWMTLGRTIFFNLEFRRQIVWDCIFACLLANYIQYSIFDNFNLTAVQDWALVWATPSLILGAIAGLTLYAIIRYKEWQRFALPMSVLALVSIVPIIVFFCLYDDLHFMHVICAGVGVAMQLAMMIVGREKYFLEVRKKLHF